jgi:hypothetical protein
VDVFSTSIVLYPTRKYRGDAVASLDTSATSIAAELVRALPGEVFLYGLPTDATILVDEKPAAWRRDRPLDLAPGRHDIRVRRVGFGEALAQVDVEYGTPVYRDLSLGRKSRTTAMLRSLFVPGLGQFYSERSGRGTFYLIVELAALGGVGYTAYANTAANSDYDDAKSTYLSPPEGSAVTQAQLEVYHRKMTDAYDRTGSTSQLNLVALGAFAALHLADILDAGIGFPDLDRVQIVPKPSGATVIQVRIQLAGRDGR